MPESTLHTDLDRRIGLLQKNLYEFEELTNTLNTLFRSAVREIL
jgi:hypothetical protein